MTVLETIKQGIAAIRQGNIAEGDRLLRYALQSEEVTGTLRARTCNWLAQAAPNADEKIKLYRAALIADPNNTHANDQLNNLLLASIDEPSLPDPPGGGSAGGAQTTPGAGGTDWDLPFNPNDLLSESSRQPSQPGPTQPGSQWNTPVNPQPGPTPVDYNNPGAAMPQYPAQTPPQPGPTQPGQRPRTGPLGQGFGGMREQATPQPTQDGAPFYPTVTILGGPNGKGTGFFVSQAGLIATTRFVVSAMETILVELEPNNRVEARVMRAYPEFDLALIESGVRVSQVLTATSQTIIPDNAPLNAYNHDGRVMTGVRRATRSEQRPGWFPTTIAQAYDAGGNPILDDRNFLVGMLTRNANRTSSYLFGLHIALIYQCVERYYQELNSGTHREFCPTCGYLSQAAGMRGFYCEICGSVLPSARQQNRYPLPQPHLEAIFGETHNRPCRFCGSRAGLHDHVCLRCGLDSRTQDGRPLSQMA